jgi:hypothetical protein
MAVSLPHLTDKAIPSLVGHSLLLPIHTSTSPATTTQTGHDFSEGSNELRGRTCPWNTFALWSVDHLSVIGFPPVGDGHGHTRENGGVEVLDAVI